MKKKLLATLLSVSMVMGIAACGSSNTGSETAGDQTATDGTATDGIANDTTKKYASKPVTIDFSSVSFTEPGVYRYKVIEGTAPAGSSVIGSNVRTLDVNVVDEDGSLVISSYVMYYGELSDAQSKTTVKKDTDKKNAAASDIAVGDKCDNFINKYPSQNMYIAKKVEGNQGSKDKYFRITVSLTNAGNGTLINVEGDYTTDAISNSVNSATTIVDADLDGQSTYTNPTNITTSTTGTAEVHFYLQGGQYINIMGIPEGATYTITEDDYTSDGYVKTETSSTNTFTIGTGTSAKTFKDATTGTIGTDDLFVGFINTKNGVIPTGVLLSATGLIIVGIIVVIGVVFFGIRSKKRYEEE